MHRAEKSSSRICRNREVERAQELHRKKLDGVKSYLTSVVSRPAVGRSTGVHFRRFKSIPGSLRADSSCCESTDPGSFSDDISEDDLSAGEDEHFGDVSISSCLSGEHTSGAIDSDDFSLDELTDQFAKMDECRSVAPVSGPHGKQQQQHHHRSGRRRLQLHHAKVPPPPIEGMCSPKRKSLNGSFRMRRLKEIQADNVGLFERIKKSAAHYSNDNLKRDWEQNVSYLSSICEFPVLLPSPRSQLPFESSANSDDGDDLFYTSSRDFKASLSRPHKHLPSIHQPAVVHPIKAIRTSPRKLQLSLSPAFRSLRKGMPQRPALPPLTAASGNSSSGLLGSLSAVYSGRGPGVVSEATAASPSPMSQFKFHLSQGSTSTAAFSVSGFDETNDDEEDDENEDGHLSDSQVLSLPSRATSIGSPFVGDLSTSSEAQLDIASPSDETKYQLLKTGRFVDGRYLVFTVFCGDGVKNPYGFDVLAFDHESAREFRLSITKEMTHELLDTITSSSQAAITAEAAGTNLSMVDIAQSICDHVNFVDLESEMERAFELCPTDTKLDEMAQEMRAKLQANSTSQQLKQPVQQPEMPAAAPTPVHSSATS